MERFFETMCYVKQLDIDTLKKENEALTDQLKTTVNDKYRVDVENYELRQRNAALKQQLEELQGYKILPCPFCGEEAFLRTHKSLSSNEKLFEVGCNSDYDGDCIKPMQNGYNTEQESIAAWNRRAK